MSLPDPDRIEEIFSAFRKLYPENQYGDLAPRISAYWKDMLHRVWQSKPAHIKRKDLKSRGRSICRIPGKILIIAYADNVYQDGEKTLKTLDRFIEKHYPLASGLHVLPACIASEQRFNDGFFSQIDRTVIHPRFGTNSLFEDIMKRRVSMADFVMNHVDIENRVFRAYLEGDDAAGECFYVFSETEYRQRLAKGNFDSIFRPGPSPFLPFFAENPPINAFTASARMKKSAPPLTCWIPGSKIRD